MDNTIQLEAKELDLKFISLDSIKPSPYNLELFYCPKRFVKGEPQYFAGGKLVIRSCEFGYITELFNEDDPPEVVVQAIHANLIIQLIKQE